jgi:ligand-binding sensor domain-containing protein/signal transduction histidine kinase
MIRRVLVYFLSACWYIQPLSADVFSDPRANEYTHRIWQTQDGLPQNAIQALAQTADGYLWIGTESGLARFDGSRFTIFDRSNTAQFRDDNILSLCAARDGSLWIGSGGGALLHYRNGSFQAFDATGGMANGFVRAIYEDRRGTMWAGTDMGLFRLNGDRLIRLNGGPDFPVLNGHAVSEDREGHVWVGGSTGLFLTNGDTLRRVSVGPDANSNRILTLEEAKDGLWVATEAGLRLLKGGVVVNGASEKLPADGNLSVFHVDREGDHWFGTVDHGLIRTRGGVSSVFLTPNVIPDNSVLSIFEDRQQSLWIGTQGGLVRLTKARVKTLTSNVLSDDRVATIYEDPNGSLWMATRSGRLYQTDGHQITPFRFPSGFPRIQARTIFRDRSGVLWIGTFNMGVMRLAGRNPELYATKYHVSVRAFHQDRHGSVWMATGMGLIMWDGQRFLTYSTADGLAYTSARAIAEDRDGDLWIGTDGGLSRIHNGKLVRDPVIEQLGNETIFSLYADADGAMWLGTRGGGLLRVKGGKISRYTTRVGLLSNTIYQILEQPSGTLWMNTPAGVFSAKREEFDNVDEHLIAGIVFGPAEGMESSPFSRGTQPAGCTTSSGQLWFPSLQGVTQIDPSSAPTISPAPIVIEAITADDRPLPMANDIRIPAGRGKLEIHYAAPDLRSPERLRFRYKLENFDRNWNYVSNHRTAFYTNLPAGNYRFRVMAENGSGQEHASEASVSLVLVAPFYRTGWAYALYALFAGSLGWSMIYIHARQTKARYKVLLAERTRLARELHDTVIQDCVGVSTLLEAAAKAGRSNPDRLTDFVDRARTQIKITLDEARQAVWDLRRESLGISIQDSLSELQQFGLEHGVPVRIETAGVLISVDSKIIRNVLLVAKEAILNAVAHASPREIAVRLYCGPRELRIEITDDGSGFDPAERAIAQHTHFGLVGMRERMAQLGGSLVLTSAPSQGTSVIAIAPLSQAATTGNNGKSRQRRD